jgi:hypothetical protein
MLRKCHLALMLVVLGCASRLARADDPGSARAQDAADIILRCRKACAGPNTDLDVTVERQRGTWQVTSAKLASLRVGESDGRQLAAFRSLRSLEIIASGEVAPGAARELAGLPRLRCLIIRGNLSDAGLSAVSHLQELEELDLSMVRSGDEPLTLDGVSHLAGLSGLRRLRMPVELGMLPYIIRLKALEE